jgi:hypothetical protein
MKRILMASLGFALALIVAAPLVAHHGRGNTYNMQNEVSLKGTVTEVAWRNPHIAIFIDVKDASGKIVNWAIEHSNIVTLAKQGYNRNSLKVGQEVTIVANPGSDGSPIALCKKVILADGTEVFGGGRNGSLVD